MHYKFTDDCLIGIEQIDEEHRGLFRLVDEADDLLHDTWTEDKYFEICDLVERLKEYAAEHFRHEEEYMEEIGHPELELQREQHAKFCEKVNEMDLRTAEGDQQALISDLLSFLGKWLYRHIIGSDLLIGKLTEIEEWDRQMDRHTFRDQFLVGIEAIDEEHKELFKILDEIHYVVVHDDTDEKFKKMVNLLKHFKNTILEHIKNEEEYMESIRYKELDMQKLAHDVFVTRLDLKDLDELDETQQTELEEFVKLVTEWVITHIVQMDKRIR